MKLSDHHQIIPGTTWDWNTDSWFGIVKVLYMGKCIYSRVVRIPYSVQAEAMKVAEEYAEDARKHGTMVF